LSCKVKVMKKHLDKAPSIKAFALLIVCMAILAVAVFLLAPQLKETVRIVREYGANPDAWVYYVILAGCILVLGGSLFLLFHKEKSGRDREVPD
jgi:uncharacterized membrane protein